MSNNRSAASGSVGSWFTLTAIGAVGLTSFDAALLERKKGFLTGGFLAEDHVTTTGQLASFVAGSLLADAAVIGVLALVALWICAPLPRQVRVSAALALAVTPLVVADIVSYQLLAYLGDAFDLSLMYELADGRSSELFAVAAGPMTLPVLALMGVAAALAAGVWLLFRIFPAPPEGTTPVGRGGVRFAALLFVLGTAVTAGMSAADDVLDNGLRRKPSGAALQAVSRTISDFDRDGYAAIGRLADPAPFDARVFPFAVDVPDNGLDENGIGGDLPGGPAFDEQLPALAPWSYRPNVVLIMLESFRGDLVGAKVAGRKVTPTLDALAARGISARIAYSHNGYTVQSRHHIFSGTLANLGGDRSTLIDDFKQNGYEIAWVSGQDESFGSADLKVGFDRADFAFDARTEPELRYSTFTTPGSLAVPAHVVVDRVDGFLRSRTAGRPFLLYVNFHDTHFPYHHKHIRPLVSDAAIARHQIAPDRAAELQVMYANTAANVDAAIADVLRLVEERAGTAPGVIVIGDHGESLFDESFLGHGYALNDAQTRIPLVAANLPLVVTEPFGQSDLRAGIRAALAQPVSGAADLRPTAVSDPDKAIFQYLGTIDRPRQIAFVSLADRILYDLRTRRARVGDGGWTRTEHLPPPDRARVIELIRYWERMKLARAKRAGSTDAGKGEDTRGFRADA